MLFQRFDLLGCSPDDEGILIGIGGESRNRSTADPTKQGIETIDGTFRSPAIQSDLFSDQFVFGALDELLNRRMVRWERRDHDLIFADRRDRDAGRCSVKFLDGFFQRLGVAGWRSIGFPSSRSRLYGRLALRLYIHFRQRSPGLCQLVERTNDKYLIR